MTTSRKPRPPRNVAGVTGHRFLPDESKVTRAVDLALERIVTIYRPRPRTVLSPLAGGAGQLVTNRVLARPGAAPVAALPITPAEYPHDVFAGEKRGAFPRGAPLAAAPQEDFVPYERSPAVS